MSSNASSDNPVPVPPHKRAELGRLTKPPRVAWPSVALMLYIVLGVVAVDAAALGGWLPLRAAAALNVLFMWPVFHVAHDSLHRAISTNARLNEWVGRIALFMLAPHAPLSVFRHVHLQHHRLTNDPRDPDHYTHGTAWTRALRWMTFDLYYALYCLRSGDPRGRQAFWSGMPQFLATVAAVVAACALGFGSEVLLLWLIPSRIALGLIGFVFLWLPHIERDAGGRLVHIRANGATTNNLTAGTTLRFGYEGLLDPLMQWHNYHLIHHLWPTTPSYRHRQVWALMSPELRERDLRIQHGFALVPQFHPAGSTLPADRT